MHENDLTPAEKLQLIEDLWNSLTETPEAIPVHDCGANDPAAARPTLR